MTDQLRVLLVDDDPEDRYLIHDALTRDQGGAVDVTTVEDGEAATSILRDAEFDVVLVDYHLPGMDGVQFLSRVRMDDVNVPVVVLTGQGSEEVAVEFMKAGAADYLTKRDLQAGRLRQTIKNVVQAHRDSRALHRERRERQEELARLNAELRERTGRLERKNRELDEFARVVSHDLREPLRTIKGFSQILEVEAGEGLQDEAHEALRYIRDGVDRMEVLITDLLRYARLSEGADGADPVDLDEVLSQALSNLAEAIAETETIVTRGRLPTVMGERTQMVQLLQNLVGNAIKFKRPDRPLTIHVDARRADGGWEEVTVADNGIGIAPRHQDRIFRVFQQLHPRGQYEGTGVGLAIAKKIVERHGGRIWVTGQEGEGATFHMTLPRNEHQGTS